MTLPSGLALAEQKMRRTGVSAAVAPAFGGLYAQPVSGVAGDELGE